MFINGKRALIISCCLLMAGCGGREIDRREVQLINGLAYKYGETDPFTGQVTHMSFHEYWSDSCTGHFEKGVIAGEVKCLGEDGKVVYDGHWDGPTPNGSEGKWAPGTGQKIYEATWVDGTRDGRERSWTDNGMLSLDVEWSHGDKSGVEKQWTPDGELYQDFIWSNGKVSGHQKAVKADNWIELTYKNGLLDGVRKQYGGPEAASLGRETHFTDGMLDGEETFYAYGHPQVVRQWTKGMLKSETIDQRLDSGGKAFLYEVTCPQACQADVGAADADGLMASINYDAAQVKQTQWRVPVGASTERLSGTQFDTNRYDGRYQLVAYGLPSLFPESIYGKPHIDEAKVARWETTFANGRPNGSTQGWDEDGNLMLSAQWEDGKLLSANGPLWDAAIASFSDHNQPKG